MYQLLYVMYFLQRGLQIVKKKKNNFISEIVQ